MATKKGTLEGYRKKRDFARTPEPKPSARGGRTRRKGLRFVVQKHDARQLHFDFRLEMEGVMRSWAVPKGPSLDPDVRRLAMEVEDHPMEYNSFEGTIPEGEYGGGTVMLWDQGTFAPDDVKTGEDPEAALVTAYRKGKLSFTMAGERLKGSFTLVRTNTVKGGERSKWLLIKHQDEHAAKGEEVTETVETSVTTGRTMEEIADGKGGKRVWHSNRPATEKKTRSTKGRAAEGGSRTTARGAAARASFPSLTPMLASTGTSVPEGKSWIFEPKYDGIRVLAFVTGESVALITRNGHDKARQFPEIVGALATLAEDVGMALVLDGEIVALEKGKIARFENLQGRMHVQDGTAIHRLAKNGPAALVVFDLLLEDKNVLVHSELSERRKRLEALLAEQVNETIRLSEVVTKPDALLRRARREGWEGVIAKRTDSKYLVGKRTGDWLKLKLENRQELVIGGWTEPRKTRTNLGAILLGYYDENGDFVYAGHTGTGFRQETLRELHRQLKPLERKTPPFATHPRTNEKAHWVSPKVVAEIKFNEWTRDGKLRQPVFIGVRDDKDPREVVREPIGTVNGKRAESGREQDDERGSAGGSDGRKTSARAAPAEDGARKRRDAADGRRKRGTGAAREGAGKPAAAANQRGAAKRGAASRTAKRGVSPESAVLRKLQKLAETDGGELKLGEDAALPITNLDKVFFPRTGHTKGNLLEYYARMADYILPAMRDRPLVLKRFPNGVESQAFYQQAAPDSVPPGVRVETLRIEGKKQRRFVGGNLATLLYTIQLGAISYDPWHSRVEKLDSADYTILDLDPGPGADFRTVIEVARAVKEELDEFGLTGALKTSGSSGLHIYLPLKRGTPLDAAVLVTQIVATRIARRYPKIATIERMTKKRPKGTVYVDYLQNILGKTVAGVYAVRAKPQPTVSTPVSWDELTDDLDLGRFTIDTVPARVAEVGDLWAEGMSKPNSLDRLIQRAG